MHRGEPVADTEATAPHATHPPAATHEGHGHAASHDSQPPTPERPACPHCPLAGATNVGHDVCAATESPENGGFVTAQDTSHRPQLALAPKWLLPAARASPPLVANLPPHAILPVTAVPLRLTHCVLLI